MKKQPKQAFTLIELLTVIAIIGILASILIPTVGRVRESARRTVDASNLRQIGQASLIYANDNREQLPPNNLGNSGDNLGVPVGPSTGNTTTVSNYAAALARFGGINDASLWVSASDGVTGSNPSSLSTVLNAARNGYGPAGTGQTFDNHPKSFAVISGLNTSRPSTTPIAYTRGLVVGTGQWDQQRTVSVYGRDGGHIVFLGGNVAFYKDLGPSDTEGRLIDTQGQRTRQIDKTITGAAYIRIHGASTSSVQGTGT